jgi:pimeloyl-ACP methyl ester carboxylesterase
MGVVELADGARLEFREYGRQDAPIAVVLLHGWTLNRRIFRPQITGLAGDDLRVIAYDARGHGQSPVAGLTTETATVERLADDLAEFLDAVLADGQRAVLVGHSLGGMTILDFAHRHADLVARRCAGAVLVATSAEGSLHTDYGFASPRAVAAARWVEINGAQLLARAGDWRPYRVLSPTMWPMVRWLLFGRTVRHADIRLTAAAMFGTPLVSVGGFRPSVHNLRRLHDLAALGELPVTVLVGTRDRLTPPRCAEAITAALPGSTLRVLDGAGHMLTLERPDEVTLAIQEVATAAICST